MFGSMPNARKGADLRRDPRFALHGATVDPVKGSEAQWPGEVKISGRAIAAGPITARRTAIAFAPTRRGRAHPPERHGYAAGRRVVVADRGAAKDRARVTLRLLLQMPRSSGAGGSVAALLLCLTAKRLRLGAGDRRQRAAERRLRAVNRSRGSVDRVADGSCWGWGRWVAGRRAA